VRTIPASCQPQKPDSPAAAWYFFIFFTKNFHFVKIFCEKDQVSSALPEPALSVVEWGDIPAKCGMPDTYQHWSFRVFRSFRGIRGPNCHRVTRVIHRSPGFRRWDASRGNCTLPGKPDPVDDV
jgi:hypothetical protein